VGRAIRNVVEDFLGVFGIRDGSRKSDDELQGGRIGNIAPSGDTGEGSGEMGGRIGNIAPVGDSGEEGEMGGRIGNIAPQGAVQRFLNGVIRELLPNGRIGNI
jgi:hypothetical protein